MSYVPIIALFSWFNRAIGRAASGYYKLDDGDVIPTYELGRMAEVTAGTYSVAQIREVHAGPGSLTSVLVPAPDGFDAAQHDLWLMGVGADTGTTLPNVSVMALERTMAADPTAQSLVLLLFSNNTGSAVGGGSVVLTEDARPLLEYPLPTQIVGLGTLYDVAAGTPSIRTRSTSTAAGTFVWSLLLWHGPRGMRPRGVA